MESERHRKSLALKSIERNAKKQSDSDEHKVFDNMDVMSKPRFFRWVRTDSASAKDPRQLRVLLVRVSRLLVAKTSLSSFVLV
jgi:hypothetical protein